MTLDALLFQALNGLAAASGLFFVGAGLSLIFGVSRIVNLAHGSLYMLGIYIAYSIATAAGGALGFWGSLALAPLAVAAIGALIEIALLRRIYRAPELFQLLATFAVLLVINDATLLVWGNEDLFGPRAPGLRGSIEILGRRFPSYDLFLLAAGPLVLAALHLMLARTRFGRLVRAATEDREMVGALGVNQALLFTAVFACGAFLAGLGGGLELARQPANLGLDLTVLGSVSLNLSKLTLVAEFLVMAVVLIARPYGLLGRPQAAVRGAGADEPPLRPVAPALKLAGAGVLAVLMLLPLLERSSPYTLVLGIDVLIAVLFAASLHFIMGPGGMHSFGHAAYFGLGAYGAGLLVKFFATAMPPAILLAPLAAGAGALVFGWFAVRLSGVYLAMLTLAFAQIVWAIAFQWEDLTGGSNGILGIWPTPPFERRAAYYLLTLALAAAGVLALWRMLFAPFGYAMRAGRDSPLRAEAIGIDVKRVHWVAFAIAGTAAGLAGALFAFAKGSISPETISVGRSVDAMVMVLLGGLQTLTGPAVGAAVFAVLQDTVMRQTEFWRALLGGVILLLVLAFPGGIVGALRKRFSA